MWSISMCWLYAITKYRYVPTIDEVLAAIEDAERLGFEFIELEGVGRQLYKIMKYKDEIKRKCEEANVKIIDFVPVLPDLMSENEKERVKALKDFRAGCELASYFNSEMVQADTFHLPIHVEVPYSIEEEFRYSYRPPRVRVDEKFNFWEFFENVVVQTIAECNDLAADYNLKLCIEPRTWENVPNPWAFNILVREIKSSNLGAVLDVAHLAAQKAHPTICVEMLGNRIFYVHASDNNFLTEDHLEIGTGMVDWKGLLTALKKHQFKGYIGIDVGGRADLKSNLDIMYMNSKRYLLELMREIKNIER